ncbi:hypothetical protein [Roseivivax isoporae]|uniref:Membrane protein n=1 Tax=Roseivivax isoporae LMG 25204 TaxID=1449351 RepID=X7F1V0_9RHOB|nr:hypothetical protein [Roseivivax isoporae]ETX26892.1 membrane protein [Roseivivax isoporae LMG 25204]
MIHRIAGATVRAFLMAWLVALPALVLPDVAPDIAQIVALLSMLAALLTFVEYFGNAPSVIEFRSAPPFNRLRYMALLLTLLSLTVLVRHPVEPSLLGGALSGLGYQVGLAMDFPFSPVRLILLALPEDADGAQVALMRSVAGMAYVISMVTVMFFVTIIRMMNWPVRRQPFNVWTNLPLFDPTAGGDVLARLKRDGHVNMALGFLLPFMIPAAIRLAHALGGVLPLDASLTLVWTMTAWAFLPASLVMRGVALLRIANLIEEKRRRAYARSEALHAV